VYRKLKSFRQSKLPRVDWTPTQPRKSRATQYPLGYLSRFVSIHSAFSQQQPRQGKFLFSLFSFLFLVSFSSLAIFLHIIYSYIWVNIRRFIKSPLTFKGSSHFPVQEQAPKLLIRAKSKRSRIRGLITLHHGLLSSIMGSQTPIRQVNSISFSLCAPVSIVPSRQSSTMLTSGQLQILPTTYL
jgi:hypothetical protein